MALANYSAAPDRVVHVGRAAQVPPTSHYLVSPLEAAMITHAIFDHRRQLDSSDRRKRKRKITTSSPKTNKVQLAEYPRRGVAASTIYASLLDIGMSR